MRAENAILVELFRHNLWANRVMLDVCRETDPMAYWNSTRVGSAQGNTTSE